MASMDLEENIFTFDSSTGEFLHFSFTTDEAVENIVITAALNSYRVSHCHTVNINMSIDHTTNMNRSASKAAGSTKHDGSTTASALAAGEVA